MAPASNRQLSLTEELERLDQSVTLTLQEIDANFSRAHRIVTSSIIPTIASYGRHSDAVWQGSKFWKEFFEASANISLTGYEEPDATDVGTDGGDATQTTVGADSDEFAETSMSQDVTETPRSRLTDEMTEEEIESSSLVDSPSMSVKAAAQRTPKTVPRSKITADQQGDTSSFAEYPSPYETLRQEMQGEQTKAPATPHEMATPSAKPSAFKQTAEKRQQERNPDPLLHRVLDQNYRIRATPHTARRGRYQITRKDPTPQPTRTNNPALDSSPFSPAMEAPKLRAEIFGTPGDKKRTGRSAPPPTGPRTPGVSVQRPRSQSGFTPGGDVLGTTRKTLFTGQGSHIDEHTGEQFEIDWESDDDSAPFGGMSPPKTIQFNLPQSKLLQTPAREASKRMVDDLLLTAGGSEVTESHELGEAPHTKVGDHMFGDDDSPSVVRVTGPGADDTF